MAAPTPSFSVVDYLVFSASLLISLSIGMYQWYRSRGQDTKDFFLGGGNMSPVTLALSLTAGMISAVSILGNSAEMYYFGSQLWMNVFGVVLGTAVSVAFFVPIIFPLKCISIFEYLEVRWRSCLMRRLATVLQVVNLGSYMGIALYAPSLAISSVTPITTNTSVVIMGVVCCLYASLGGARAVVYTDAFQSLVMVMGVVVVVARGLLEVGGGAKAWDIDQQYGRIDFFNLDTNPLVRHTLMSTLIFGVFFAISNVGVNQPQYQRWVSVSTLSQSYLVVVLGAAGVVALWSLIFYAGLVVFAVYADCDPLAARHIEKPDQILMYFVADKLGSLPGIPGLFVAAVYSGVLSTISSVINSITAMVWKDLLQPLKMFADASEAKAKKINIIISACAGLVAVVGGLLAGTLGNLVQVTFALAGAFAGPITGIMLTAVLCPWVKLWSVFLGSMVALVLDLWIVMGNFLHADPPEMLFVSTTGCTDPNTTTTANTTPFTTSSIITTTDDGSTGYEVFPLYRLSYCLYGAIGVLTTLVMSTVFSCVFGFAAPSSVPPVAVNKSCLRFYCWLRGQEIPLGKTSVGAKYPVQSQHSQNTLGSTSSKGGPLKLGDEVGLGVSKSRDAPAHDNPVFTDDHSF